MSNREQNGCKAQNCSSAMGDLAEPEWYSRDYLPHRDKAGLTQSVTFRLADSIPCRTINRLEQELRITPHQFQDFERRQKIEELLDKGLGSCALKHPLVANKVQTSLLHFDGCKYHLLAWCIMPTHVHVLLEPLIPLSRIVKSWKSFTGRWALSSNERLSLGLTGNRFWMREYWDRYIRDQGHLSRIIRYIHQNPVKAGLCATPEQWQWSSARLVRQGEDSEL